MGTGSSRVCQQSVTSTHDCRQADESSTCDTPVLVAVLFLLRHGESAWNNAEVNLFCGWVDVDLSSRGVEEAHLAAVELKKKALKIDVAFTSFLKRANNTLKIILDDLDESPIQIHRSWRLNERHYGGLTGLNKHDAVEKFGLRQVEIWRRSFDVPPPPLDVSSLFHPTKDPLYASVDPALIPSTESLKDVTARFLPYFETEIKPRLLAGECVLVVSHGSVTRCITKILLGMSDSEVEQFDVPTAIPYLFEFDANLNVVRNYFLAEEGKVKAEQEKIRNQIRK